MISYEERDLFYNLKCDKNLTVGNINYVLF